MFQYKLVKLGVFSVAFLATTLFGDSNKILAQSRSAVGLKPSKTIIDNQNIVEDNDAQNLVTPKILNPPINRIQQQDDAINRLIADSNSRDNNVDIAESKIKFTRLIFLLLLLFFIFSVIFYPLFLFYRKILGINYQETVYNSNDDKSSKPDFLKHQSSENFSFEEVKAPDIATVSKLQIAFSAQARQLRQKLGQISSITDLNQNQDIVDLICKTVLALVSQQDWTHVSCTSVSLPQSEMKAEFKTISHNERNKFINRESILTNYRKRARQGNSSYQDSYRYVVVTLILCTTHNTPLFNKIHTEQQLIEELAKLSKLSKDSLIKFELLWNPQQDNTYLDNDELLMQYSDMTRLL